MMNKYEAMIIVLPGLSDQDKEGLFNQIRDTVSKNKGEVSEGAVWGQKRKLYFPIKKQVEGVYYLLKFSLPPLALKEVRKAYSLNENILRVLITKL